MDQANDIDILRKRTEKLTDEGFECLRNGDYERALEIAEHLEKLRFSAAFEIAAQAHAGLENLEKAVDVLERGVEKAPDCCLNWQLLGNYLSDLGRYEQAEIPYHKYYRLFIYGIIPITSP